MILALEDEDVGSSNAQRVRITSKVLMDADKAVGVLEGKWPQENGFNDRECGGHAADSERKREDCGKRESWRFTQLPESESGVMEKTFEERKCAALAPGLSCLFHAAQSDQGIPARLLRSHAGTEIIVDVHLKMGFELGGKLIVSALGVKNPD